MELVGVRVEVPANTPVLVLREQDGDHRVLPIYIGGPEATSIHQALEGIEPPRPLTHDLFVNVLGELGTRLDRIVITEVRDHTFFAELHLQVGGENKVVSSRPSDAVALAVRTGSPLFASEDVLESAGQAAETDAEEDVDADEIIDEFRDFIENINPEDFAG
jgi:bifunctional DNase/RNase